MPRIYGVKVGLLIRILLILPVGLMVFPAAGAAQDKLRDPVNKVDVGVSLDGKPIANGDTVWAGIPATFDIYFETDDTLGGYSTGFTIYSDDGAAWKWLEGILDFKLISNSPLQLDTIYSIVTTVKGSRHHPPSVVLDNGGLQIAYADTNGSPRDAILFGGTRRSNGLPPGKLEKVIQMHFVAGGVTDEEIAHICIDSAKVGAVGEFVFVDVSGTTDIPEVLWPAKGRCWPVAKLRKKE